MARLFLWFLRTYLRLAWFLLAVVPGDLLMRAHQQALHRRRHPSSGLLPPVAYRVAGFALTVLFFSGISGILALFGNGGAR
jgi:hypothetical protein